ncbi:glycoside hydrolase family 13 protein [Colwellia sp. 1_MG-2023]|uniref:glycoside hydrolase family 13 protein n=1 Tax=Colwellia sp. 1_MG-2023 TaxID=3062649 RepID=UPI0026E1BAD9|nr:glycoside hydrolase family 13 protein [Colwellia sp. 1_MG-2023]MDO6445357.1 glycoside hydrolase family 13 protein [Colwellia sp. 1_MG-2023]
MLLCPTIQAQAYKIEHLEPISWWNNMQSNSLQIMVHGKNISNLTPRIQHDSLRIDGIKKVENSNYLFIDLTLSENLKPGKYAIDFYQDNVKVLTHQYDILSRNKLSAAETSFTAKDVIYLITTDRFSNGDKSNDSVETLIEKADRSKKGGRHGGDIQGIINQLAYLQDMGFTQIWTMPMVENDMADHSYHGYSATDFYQIDPRFGSNELYQKLANQAQAHGIGLIKDVVLNHIGANHWWMKDLPTSDWLNYQNSDFTGTQHRRESLHDPHASQHDKTLFADGWFVPTMPDLNQRNELLSNYLIQNTLWWIEYANLSGLRVDTYSYSDKAFLSTWTKRITEEYPNINIVGEEWATNPAIVSYWQRGKKTHDGYQSYLPSVMDFPLQAAIVAGLTHQENWNTGLNELYQAIANDFQYADPYNLVTFTDNHDMSRIYTQLNEDLSLFKMAMGYLLTSRGIPQVYYGTEVLLANPTSTDHGIIRSDFPGGWQGDKHNAFQGLGLTNQQTEAQSYIRSLLNWRKNAKAIHHGKLTHFAPKNGVYVYFREYQNEKIMVVLNKNKQQVPLNPMDYNEVIQLNKQAINVLTGESLLLTNPVSIPSQSISIWQIKEHE